MKNCNDLELRVINFNKNFELFTAQSIKIHNISYDRWGFGDNYGLFTLGSNNGLYTRCIFNNTGLLLRRDPSDGRLHLFYSDINKEITFKHINTLYKDYFIDLIEELKELKDGYANVLNYIEKDGQNNNN